jgi:hypothetical protein
MAVSKNVQFSILIKIEGRLREFNFRRLSENTYDADVSGEGGIRHSFAWFREDGNWQLFKKSKKAESLPEWIVNNTSSIREGFLTEIL